MTRLYTEDKNREGIIRVLDSHFEGYTVIPTLGRWRGVNEQSLCIELIGADTARVLVAAEQIKVMNSQESVLVTTDAHTVSSFV
jgi:hypothetical protein